MTFQGETIHRRLANVLTNKQAVLVVGTGVTVHATGGAKSASWEGLLESGLDYGMQFGELRSGKTPEERERWRDSLASVLKNTGAGTWVTVAQEITRVLDRPNRQWRKWLEESIGSLKAADPEVLVALRELAKRFSVVMLTTNYDDLLARTLDVTPVTWKMIDDAREIMRDRSSNVLHIHGLWSDPDSIVLGSQSYSDLLSNELAQVIQKAAATFNSLVFIGCGDGIRDENIGGLLSWIEGTLKSSGLDNFILLRDDAAKSFTPVGGLLVVPYGSTYADLPLYLNSLVPTVDQNLLQGEIVVKKAQVKLFGEAWVERNQRFTKEQPIPDKGPAGEWEGFQTQQVGPAEKPINYRVALHVDASGDKLAGTFHFRFGPEGALVDETPTAEGTIANYRFLRLSYQGGDPGRPHFGELLLELAQDGESLVGIDIGYGYTTRQLQIAATRFRRSDTC